MLKILVIQQTENYILFEQSQLLYRDIETTASAL